MLQNLSIFEAITWSASLSITLTLGAIFLRKKLKTYAREYEQDIPAENKESLQKRAKALSLIILILSGIAGLFIGTLLHAISVFRTALSHGMVANLDTGQYEYSYGEMIAYNKNSMKETDISVDELKNNSMIFVRYDCPDCMALHDSLSQLTDMVFISSQSDLGKTAREVYDIILTEVPQGVYINSDGIATTISIIQHVDDAIMLDLQQITILREMATRHD